jgi:hypothetical protein
MKDISWDVLPLVAGLFVLVDALDHSGVLKALIHVLQMAADRSAIVTTWVAAGKSGGERLDLSETRYIGDAAGFASRDCGPAGHLLRSLLFLAYNDRSQTVQWTPARCTRSRSNRRSPR